MKYKLVQTQNMVNLCAAIKALESREDRVPGLGLVHGRAGLGKTEALTWYAVNYQAIYVRAEAIWTPKTMLEDICTELGMFPYRTTKKIYDQVVAALQQQRQTLIIDEADFLLRDSIMLETVRGLHDNAKTPIVIAGMDEICGRLMRYLQFWSRISYFVEFKPLTAPEIIVLCREWTGLALAADAADLLMAHTDGDFRLVLLALVNIEKAAKLSKQEQISKDFAGKSMGSLLRKRGKGYESK